jgi:hypothetical protein
MTISAWKTNFIGLNKPPKVLVGTADSFTPYALWPHANGVDDPYWSGGVNPQAYQWTVTFSVSTISHGSHLTRTPFYYDAQDIEVGDFVAGAADGKVCQIMSITEKTNNSVTAIVEDRLRYNTFRDPTGFGLFNTPGNVIFFSINELGFPMIDPVPGVAATDFFTNVMSRFQYMNPLTNYLLEKEAHGFEQGDAVCIDNGEFALSSASNIVRYIGTVIHAGPGPDQFILRPSNGVIDFVPGLPGNVGDYIYPSIDGTGDLTTDPASSRPVFMKIANAVPSISAGTGIDPGGTDGDQVEINGELITFVGQGSGTYNIDDAVNLINASTAIHRVVADKVGAATEVASDIAGLGSSYGLVGGFVPFSATINGILVTFTTTTSGSAAYGPGVADAVDMIEDINDAGIENVVASLTNGSELKIRHTEGGAIDIVNVTNDANGSPWAGPGSLSSLALSTPANTTTFSLKLEREDGGPLTLKDMSGLFFYNAGVMSGQTGRYSLGLNIEQGLRSSSTTMVANIAARDALHALPGDQAYVIDAGNGEWAVYMWDGTSWLQFSNKRSDETDAKTLTQEFDLSTISSGEYSIGFISAGRRIVDISVDVTGSTGYGNSVEVISADTQTVLMNTEDSSLDINATYTVASTYKTQNYEEIKAVLTVGNPAGSLKVSVTYV